MDGPGCGGEGMDWKHLLASITGTVDQALLLRNEYLVTENRILRHQITGRVRLTDGERTTLAAIGQKLGKQDLEEVATIVKPGTILGWYRKLVAQKFDGSQQRKAPGRPAIDPELEALVVHMAQENRAWGYDRIVGALANLGYTIRDQTVGNILKRSGIPPAPERKKTMRWSEFIRIHMGAGCYGLLHEYGMESVAAGPLYPPGMCPCRSSHEPRHGHGGIAHDVVFSQGCGQEAMAMRRPQGHDVAAVGGNNAVQRRLRAACELYAHCEDLTRSRGQVILLPGGHSRPI